MRSRFAWVAAVVALAAGVTALACSDSAAPPAPCHDIPAGGCPLSGANACSDPSCSAVYACNNGAWTFDHTCPVLPGTDAGTDAPMEAEAAPPTFDAAFDAPPGANGVGCSDLDFPDCTLGLALSCGPGCCGCEALFICQNMTWLAWGQCIDGGIVPP